MHPDQQGPFRIGVTRDVRRPDGSFAFTPDLSALEVNGVEWAFLAGNPRPLTPDLLADLDGLYHFSTPVTAESLDGVDRLVVLARHGVGLDFVDVEACTRRGIAVTITPQGVTRPMASAAVTLVLAAAHRLRERDRALHDGDWGSARFEPTGFGLTGRTLGVIGYGRIGHEVVRLLEPWEMRVLVTQRTPVADEGVSYVPLETLLAEADVVVVACPLTDVTRGLLDARRLALMKPTAFLVNISRGAIVDQAALVGALRDGRLAGAGLDVVDPEPLPADAPLLELPNVVGAPHSLGYTDQLIRGCVEGACRSLLAAAAGRVPDDLANPEVLANARFTEKLGRFRLDS
ncbi:MAG: dehydrogenase [Actinobacteria bacterium]|nr:MAG: dehydrogenase [Actinomycetota bacterium]